MENIETYRLAAGDISSLREINELFADVFEDADNYAANKPSDEYMQTFLANEENIVIAASYDGQIVGGLVAYTLNKFEQQRKEVYLYDMAVATTAQRKGIGKMLVNELRRVAKQNGAYVVFVQADEGDDAVKFYESMSPIENLRTRNFDFEV